MRSRSPMQRIWAALALLLLTTAVQADEDPLNDPSVQKTLRAMANASTWYHPDLFGMTAGMLHYAHHDYGGALKYFEIGAFFADKLSQLSIGLMHLNGEGTPKDLVSAWAWIDLAAERDYPDFVATRDNLKAMLSPQQLAQAMILRKALAERYADTVAKWRMTVQLRQGQMHLTGSLTGFDFGVIQATFKPCGPALVLGGRKIPQIGCGDGASLMAKENWQPDLYFAARDREWKATVTVGAVEQQKSAPGATSGKAQNKPKSDAQNQ
jgi:hypothetical protein